VLLLEGQNAVPLGKPVPQEFIAEATKLAETPPEAQKQEAGPRGG